MYKALQGGTDEEFSLAFTACINCSDSDSEASEELDNSAEDNEIQVVSAYLLAGETRNPRNPSDEPLSLAGLSVFDPP